MKKQILICSFLLFTISAISQNSNSNLYSGGMLILQPGFTITKNNHQNIHSHNFGLGGILRFYFYEYFTAGIYGGTQRTRYDSPNSVNSYISIGYGGPILGFSRKIRKVRYTLSGFVGKGTIRNLHIESQSNNLLTDAYLYKHSTIVFSPILSVDYALSQRILLTMQ
ncbi:MAG: hypothetical protein CVT98_03770, partial [Bacteroidetes bacterium HGW-Bacteroidetes-15]